MTRPDCIPAEYWNALPAELRPGLLAIVAMFDARIAELEAKLSQNSSNSSRPPSSDGSQVKRGVPRPPGRRRRGGQKGHPKAQRTILPPDEVVDHKPTQCSDCGTPLAGDDPEPRIDQVIELPVKLRHVTHHRRHTLECPRCRARTAAASVPEAACGFGPRLQASAAYLTGVGRPGKRAIRRFFVDLCGIPIATGSAGKLEAKTGAALEAIRAETLDHVRGLDANVDETGWEQGLNKAWLWVAVTKAATVFPVRKNRDRAAFDDLVGPSPGVLTTDRFSVYKHLPSTRRQVCWAHLRRDFQAMTDRRDRGSPIGGELLMYADILAEGWRKVREGVRTRPWFRRSILPWLREEIRVLLEAGARCVGTKTSRVCGELLGLEPSLWTFASREGVEPTNAAAERAVRHAVCWRKTSYGTASDRGSRSVERLLTVVSSCRIQGRDVLDFLVDAIHAHRSGRTPPLLIPAKV
jgi:transposase